VPSAEESRPPAAEGSGYRLALALFYAGMAWAMTYYITQLPVRGLTAIEPLLAGTAPRPFQYRILGPWTITALHDLTGIGYASAELLWHFAATLAAFVAVRTWLRSFVPAPVADLAPVWVTATVVNNLMLRYPWDLPGIFFAAVLLELIRQRSWRYFLPVLAVATLNRESTYLAVVAVFLAEGLLRRSWPRALGLSAAAAAVWLAVKIALGHAYAANPGGALEWHLGENLDILRGEVAFADVLHTPLLAPVAGAPPWCWLPILAALNFAWVLVPVRWRAKDPLLRTLALLIPFHLGLMVLFGNLAERRIYLDVLPVVLPLALQTFWPPESGGRSMPSRS
jgi:hypothetical protein